MSSGQWRFPPDLWTTRSVRNRRHLVRLTARDQARAEGLTRRVQTLHTWQFRALADYQRLLTIKLAARRAEHTVGNCQPRAKKAAFRDLRSGYADPRSARA